MNLVMSTLSPDAVDDYVNTQNVKIVKDKQSRVNDMLEGSIDAHSSSVFNFDNCEPIAANNNTKRKNDLGRTGSTSGLENQRSAKRISNLSEEQPKRFKVKESNTSKTKEKSSNETSALNQKNSVSLFGTEPESQPIRKSMQSLRETESEEICVIFEKESDQNVISNDDDLCIPASPKPKIRRKMKNVFRNYLEPTLNDSGPSDLNCILAENSDEEI